MLPVRWRLGNEGWAHIHLPTARYELRTMDALGEWAAAHIARVSAAHGDVPVDIVTHSMGGLVLRAALAHRPPVFRVVMLSPPNAGAELAAHMRRMLPVHHIGWDPLAPLQPGAPSSLPIPETPIEVGVLAGSRTGGEPGGKGYNPLLGADNDGKVRIDEAILAGQRAYRVVRAHHTFIMALPPVLDEVVHFMRHGTFSPVTETRS